MPDALETRLTRAGDALPEPPDGATARARAAAVAALPGPHRRAPWRRPLRVAVATAGVAALAGLLVALLVATPGGDDPAPPASLRPDVAALGAVTACADPPPDLTIRCVEGTQAVRDVSEGLRGAPWLTRGGYDRRARPSVVFPPGTSYAEALDALVVNATLTGGLPPGTTLGPPLPGRAALLRPEDPSQGIAISLAAPFGYQPNGRPYGITLTSDEPDVASEGYVWPVGTRVAVPDLPACQVVADRAAAPPACAEGEDPTLRGERAPDLPAVPLRPAPVDLTMDRLDGGGSVSLASLRGRVVVLAVFASWCEPCEDQAAAVRSVAARYAGDAEVRVLGIAAQDLTEQTEAFLRRHPLGVTVLRSPRRVLDVAGLPETLVLDREGRIAFRLAGALAEPATLEREVEALR